MSSSSPQLSAIPGLSGVPQAKLGSMPDYTVEKLPQPVLPPRPSSPQMVTLRDVEQQKRGYAEQLEKRLLEARQEVKRKVQLEQQELAQRAALEKQSYDVMIDDFVGQQALAMDHQTNLAIMRLQQEAVAQKLTLEQQAVALKAQYEEKKAEEDMMNRRMEIEKQFLENHAPTALLTREVNAQRASHGMAPCTKRPQEPVNAAHSLMTTVPPLLKDWWTSNPPSYAYVSPAMANSTYQAVELPSYAYSSPAMAIPMTQAVEQPSYTYSAPAMTQVVEQPYSTYAAPAMALPIAQAGDLPSYTYASPATVITMEQVAG